MGVIDDVITGMKQLREIAQKVRDAELQGVIADLMLKIADLKTEMAELSEENLELRRQVDELTQKADIRSKVEFRNGMYYPTEPIQGYGEGPFCSLCLEEDGLLISLHMTSKRVASLRTGTVRQVPAGWRCPRCAKKRK